VFGVARDRRHIDLDLVTVRQFRFEAVVLVLTLFIGVAVTELSRSAFASRYASVFFPLFVLLVAGGITRFADRRLLAGALATVLALSLMGAYCAATFQRSQGRQAARAINQVAEPGDLVVMCPDQLGPAYSRSLRDDVDVVTYPTMQPPQRVDWVDYGKRNEASDPAAFAGDALARAGDHQIFLVWQTTYKTFEGKCEALLETLSAARPGSTTVVSDGGSRYFEPAAVTVFPPRPASP
jgi:hypothetical protein